MRTQEVKILQYMKRLGKITARDAWLLDIGRLAARVYDLRRKGHKIDKEWKVTKGGARVAVYRLGE